MYLAKIHVSLKSSVLDPQGVAVSGALQHMGYKEVEGLRIGKALDLKLSDKGLSQAAAEKRVKEMCEKLLANTQIEKYEFTVKKVAG
jgi:phosphoribosylformylglycinamidine synthase PurS subunit